MKVRLSGAKDVTVQFIALGGFGMDYVTEPSESLSGSLTTQTALHKKQEKPLFIPKTG